MFRFPENIIELIFDKITHSPYNDCWLWTGSMMGGYPSIFVEGEHLRINTIMSILLLKVVPKYTKRLCGDKHCVNPSHFEITKAMKLEM